jgi:hypothetical protein
MRRTATAAGELKGKFAYFSPEQAEGKPLDRRSDIFSLGIVAWEAIMARRLFSGDDSMEILSKVKSAANLIPRLHEIDEEVPYAVSMAIARALERSPDARYPTAAEMAHALREASRAPTAKEISRWVNDAGGETLTRVRSMMDVALSGDDNAVTLARPSVPSVPAVPKKRPELVTLVEQTGTVNATMTTTSEIELRRRSKAPLVIGALLLAALGGGIYYASRTKEPALAAPVETAPLAVPCASPIVTVDAAPPKAIESAQPSAKPKLKPGKPATTPAKTVEPVVTAPPPTVTAPATTTAPPTKPTGPILGDEAFDKK